MHNGDGTNWSATENNDSEIVISAPPTPPPEPVSTTEPVDIRKSYYPESKVNSTSNSLFNKVYSQKLLTSVDKIERTPLELKKYKSAVSFFPRVAGDTFLKCGITDICNLTIDQYQKY